MSIAVLAVLAAPLALGAPKPLISYTPPPDEERPLITRVHAGPQGSDFAFEIAFDKVPWGDGCKPRCANATLFLDLDHDTTTGLQLGKDAKETGADLALTVQGMREYLEMGARSFLRVRVRRLTTSSANAGDGDVMLELDHRKDPERLQGDGDTVWALVDMNALSMPAGRTARVVYHPPGAPSLEGTTSGMLARAGTRVNIFKADKATQRTGGKSAKPKKGSKSRK